VKTVKKSIQRSPQKKEIDEITSGNISNQIGRREEVMEYQGRNTKKDEKKSGSVNQ
jgi:hypothetical protein